VKGVRRRGKKERLPHPEKGLSLAAFPVGMELKVVVAENLRLHTPVDPGGKSQMEGWELPGTISFST
jgi:hypothetical protein